jgi:hypothetical protein
MPTGGRAWLRLVKKLGLKPGTRALVLGVPSGYMNSLAPLPDRVEVSLSLGSAHEFVQFFATKKSEITKSAKKASVCGSGCARLDYLPKEDLRRGKRSQSRGGLNGDGGYGLASCFPNRH